MAFGGPDLTSDDKKRLGKQLNRVRDVMTDGQWRTLHDLEATTGFPQASISARLRDLRKPCFGEWVVERRRISPGVFEYRISGMVISAQLGLGLEA